MTTNLRVRWPFVVAAALSAAALVLFHLWPLGGEDDASAAGYPTAAQNAAAVKLIRSLPALPGTTRDPYATACRTTSHYCVTSPSTSARDLMRRIRDLLVVRGAKLRKSSCDESPGALHSRGCGAVLSYDHTDLIVLSTDAAVVDGIHLPASASVATEVDVDTRPVDTPLVSWRALRLFPLSWGTPSCDSPVAGGCRSYDGTLTIPLPLARAVTVVESRLAASGLVVDAIPSAPTHCFVFGKKYRGLDGTDPIDVAVMLSGTAAGTTTARLTVSDH
ncbi:MAG: hypothetical protein QOD07_475 [Frankiaceae bacterium]|jgi:hypothetical protein|nr:hypothetical protein [Frankiaceae bacterium]